MKFLYWMFVLLSILNPLAAYAKSQNLQGEWYDQAAVYLGFAALEVVFVYFAIRFYLVLQMKEAYERAEKTESSKKKRDPAGIRE